MQVKAERIAIIIGTGALGNELCKALGPIGFRGVLLIDADAIETHNLPICELLKSETFSGQSKAHALASFYQNAFPNTEWRAIQAEIADVGFERIAGSNILFSCVDNELARLEVAYIGLKLNIPICDAGVKDSTSGRVSFFPGRTQASFCCMLPQARRRELLGLWSSSSFPCWAAGDNVMPWRTAPEAAELAARLQVQTALDWFSRSTDSTGLSAQTIEFKLTPAPALSTFQIPVSADCPFHAESRKESILVPAASDTTVRELLKMAANGRGDSPVLVLDWPVCTRARCPACGWRTVNAMRLATLRVRRCSNCGLGQFKPVRVIHQVSRDSDLADWRLKDLGIPEDHVHTIQYQAD